VETEKDLIARITAACETAQNIPWTRCARTWHITTVLAARFVVATANRSCKLTENNTIRNSAHMYKQQTNCC